MFCYSSPSLDTILAIKTESIVKYLLIHLRYNKSTALNRLHILWETNKQKKPFQLQKNEWEVFYILANLFHVWLKGRQLDSPICF